MSSLDPLFEQGNTPHSVLADRLDCLCSSYSSLAGTENYLIPQIVKSLEEVWSCTVHPVPKMDRILGIFGLLRVVLSPCKNL